MDNGCEPINDHHGQEEAVYGPEQVEGIHLGEAACKGDGLALSPEVHQHLGDGGGRQEDVDQGQVGEEEVHGCVEVGVCDAGQDGEQVSKDGDQVCERNSPEEDLML